MDRLFLLMRNVLYVDNWDDKRKVIMRYEVQSDGVLTNGSVFLDATNELGEDAWDGMKVDQRGNLYLSWTGRPLDSLSGAQAPWNDRRSGASTQSCMGWGRPQDALSSRSNGPVSPLGQHPRGGLA